jgi:chitin synthase
MASTSETYTSGFNTSESNPLFRPSNSMASMSPYNEKNDPNIPQLALPPARPMIPSPASSESGRTRDPNRLPPASSYPYDYPIADDSDAPILSGFPAAAPDSYRAAQNQPHEESRRRQQSAHSRGVSLVDTGPVPAAPHDPVRRVSRHQRRSSSRNQLVSPVTGSSNSSHLPPGAVSG